MNQREPPLPTSFPSAHIGEGPGKMRLKALVKKFDRKRGKAMLALELYRDENGYPEDFIVVIEGSYDYDDYKKAILKSRDVYNNKRYESVCVVEIDRKAYENFQKAMKGEDEDYGLYE